MASLTGGRAITVYGQNEVVKDLIAARVASGRPLHFEVPDVEVHDLTGSAPRVTCTIDGAAHEITCDFIAGCDGFHGICRPAIPAAELRIYEREYPFAWLGILADAAPSSEELVYSLHERGFALFSMRSPAVTRLYLQCLPDEDIDNWPDDRIWDELRTRLTTRDGWTPNVGPITQKGDHADAELRRRTDALRPALPGRRRRAHRPANRSKGPQPRCGGCVAAGRCARRPLLDGR